MRLYFVIYFFIEIPFIRNIISAIRSSERFFPVREVKIIIRFLIQFLIWKNSASKNHIPSWSL